MREHQQNMRKGGRPSRFEPSSQPGAGLLGDAPGPGGFPGGFNPGNASILGQAPGANNRGMQMPNFGSGRGPQLGASPGLFNMAGTKGAATQHINTLLQQSGIIGNLMQQQQQQHRQQQTPLQQQQQQGLPTQNIRDTQLNIVNSLLKGVMNSGRGGPLANQMQGANSILGNPFPRPGGPMIGNMPGMKGNFRPQNPGLVRPPTPGLGLLNNPAIPSIFDINTNPTNRIAQRKRAGAEDQSRFHPDVKRYRKDSGQLPAGGAFAQNQSRPFDRPDNRNDSYDNNTRRSAPRLAVGRRDSSGSSHSDRSQNSRWQPSQGSGSMKTRDVYDPSEPTEDPDQGRQDSSDNSCGGSKSSVITLDEGDGDFSVTVDNKGRSVSDKKEERKLKPKEKRSPFYCHTCNVECNSEQNFTRHMQSDFHKECLKDLLSLTQQKSSQLQARLKAEAHLRSIEERDGEEKEGYCLSCDERFTGSLVKHRRTTAHKQQEVRIKSRWEPPCSPSGNNQSVASTGNTRKMKDKMNWPRCNVCDQTFKSPLKYVKHLSTPLHKEKRAQEKHLLPDEDVEDENWQDYLNPEDLVTLDAVGESDEESDVERCDDEHKNVTKVEVDVDDEVRQSRNMEKSGEIAAQRETPQSMPYSIPPYDGVTVVGQKYVTPVSGFFCKLCHKFYNKETTARVIHCQSHAHYNNYQKLVLSKLEERKTTDGISDLVQHSSGEVTGSAQSDEVTSLVSQSVLKENGVGSTGNGELAQTGLKSPDPASFESDVGLLESKETGNEDVCMSDLSNREEEKLLEDDDNNNAGDDDNNNAADDDNNNAADDDNNNADDAPRSSPRTRSKSHNQTARH